METSPIYYDDGTFRVTARAFRAPRRTFMLRNIEKSQLRRPALIFAAVAASAVYGFAWAFRPLIYPGELPWLLGVPALVLIAASRIGVLVLRSRSLGDHGTILGFYGRLAKVRDAIDEALEDATERHGWKHATSREDAERG